MSATNWADKITVIGVGFSAEKEAEIKEAIVEEFEKQNKTEGE